MSKKLLSIVMVLTMVLVGAATAGEHEVDIYGKLHLSTQMNNDTENSQLSLSSNTSRFGVRGKQAMNDNFTFFWQFEQMLNLAFKGNDGLANRNSFLGLKGEWGAGLFGIHDTPMKTLGRKVDFFKDQVGDFRSTTMGWDQRYDQIFMYITPDFDGFQARAMYRFDQNGIAADEAATVLSAMGTYVKDNLLVGAAFETLSKGNVGQDRYYLTDTTSEVRYGDAPTAIRAVARYDADDFSVSALFQTVSGRKHYWGTQNIGGIDLAVHEEVDAQTIGVSGLYKVAPKWAAKASYFMVDPDTDFDKDDSAQLAIGIDHIYAKDLTFYIQMAMMTNGDNAARGLGGNGWGDSVNVPFVTDPADPSFGMPMYGESPMSISVGAYKSF